MSVVQQGNPNAEKYDGEGERGDQISLFLTDGLYSDEMDDGDTMVV